MKWDENGSSQAARAYGSLASLTLAYHIVHTLGEYGLIPTVHSKLGLTYEETTHFGNHPWTVPR
jgi:hypothetical protein